MNDEAKILISVINSHSNAAKWIDAPFERIKRISNTKVGDVGQDFIEQLCEKLGFEMEFPKNQKGGRKKQNPWDIKIQKVKFELKTATEDTSGVFQFNHIRYHRPYEALLCLGISPADIYVGAWSKADIVTGKVGNLVSMEKGANASYKLTRKPNQLSPISDFASLVGKLTTNLNT